MGDEGLAAAKNARSTLCERVLRLKEEVGGELPNPADGTAAPYLTSFTEHLAADLNTPGALSDFWNLLRDEQMPAAAKLAALYRMDAVLGLGLEAMERKELSLDDEVRALVEEREQARQAKNYARADEIRKILGDRGIVLEDTPRGTRWRKKQ
jgi:cysteinyl-tRNA synthetase